MLTTKISFVVPNASTVIMNVYDAKGKLVATPVNEDKPAGVYNVNFNATSLPQGNYSYNVVTGGIVKTKQLGIGN